MEGFWRPPPRHRVPAHGPGPHDPRPPPTTSGASPATTSRRVSCRAAYTAPRMVLVGTSSVGRAAGEARGGGVRRSPPGRAVKRPPSPPDAHAAGSDVRIRDDDMQTASFCVAFKGASWNSPDAVPLMVMQAMLGSWDKSAPGAAHAGSPLAQSLAANDLAARSWRSTPTTPTPVCSACTSPRTRRSIWTTRRTAS